MSTAILSHLYPNSIHSAPSFQISSKNISTSLIAAWPVSVANTATTATSSLSPALSLVLPRLPSTQSPLNSAHQILRTALNQPKGLPAFFLTLHTFVEYLDFHPDLHALVTEGLLDADGVQSAGAKVGLFWRRWNELAAVTGLNE